MKHGVIFGAGAALILALTCMGALASAKEPENYLYMGSGELADAASLLARPDIAGVQIVYNWRQLEPEKGHYEFSSIEKDLNRVNGLGKKLFIQIQDRFFSPKARNLPEYLLNDPAYGGGLVPQVDNPGENVAKAYGWASEQWNPRLRARYQALLGALARQFDGKVFGVNLPETSIDIDQKHDKTGFSCDAYFAAELENLGFASKAFSKSHVVQYVNFWPCEWNNDHKYMSRLFAFAIANGAGVGGPDIIPYRKGQMKNSYPFFNKFKGQLALVAMAVQEPTLTYKNPKTGKPFTRNEFIAFARDYLGADIIFWSTSAPWLKP